MWKRIAWIVLCVFALAGTGCSSCGEPPEPAGDTATTDGTTGADGRDGSEVGADSVAADSADADADGGIEGEPRDKIDLLWVIDNSGSMCEEQEALRRNFRSFMETLDEANIDFNMGITTTEFDPPSRSTDPVARPGELQATPHPPVSFFNACNQTEAVRRQINAAVACTKNPSQFSDLKDASDELINCALNNQDCAAVGKDPDEFSRVDLFPCAYKKGSRCESRQEFQDVYRSPEYDDKILRAADYRKSDGTLEIDKLKRDFSCASYVGTRGSTFEMGLKAAARALSPVKTGGPVGNAYAKNTEVPDRLKGEGETSKTLGPEAPNHGLLRSDAPTAVLIVTDENDCSSPDLRVQLGEGCGQLNCYFPQSEDWEESLWYEDQDDQGKTLLNPVGELADRLRANIADSKRVGSLSKEDLVVASMHGNYEPYDAKLPSSLSCTVQEQQNLSATLEVCNTGRGSAKSGDRYSDFLADLKSDGFEVAPDPPREGFMCTPGSLQGPLDRIAKALRAADPN